MSLALFHLALHLPDAETGGLRRGIWEGDAAGGSPDSLLEPTARGLPDQESAPARRRQESLNSRPAHRAIAHANVVNPEEKSFTDK